jgi:hypothetical protein
MRRDFLNINFIKSYQFMEISFFSYYTISLYLEDFNGISGKFNRNREWWDLPYWYYIIDRFHLFTYILIMKKINSLINKNDINKITLID